VKFHSGNTVDATAAEFSIRRAFNLKQTPSFILTGFIAGPEDVAATDARTVRVTFKQPMPEILMGCVLANMVAAVVDPALIRQNALPDDPHANRWLSNNDAGSGPFRLVRWDRNVIIELQGFDAYWKGAPRLRRVFVREMEEAAAQLVAFQRGDLDVADNLLPGQYKQLAGQAGVEIRSRPSFQVRYVAMNATYEPFTKKEVRSALKWAMDYDAVRRLYEDAIDVGQTVVPTGMFAHLPERPYRKDLDRARQLLREGGYERGFKAEMLVPVDPILPDVAAKIKEDLAQIGIEIEVRVLRNADLLGVYRAQRHQLVMQRWGADYPDPDNMVRAFANFDARQLAWRTQWDHPVKRVVEQAVSELDPARRDALYKDIQKVVLEEGPFVIIGYPLEQLAAYSNVKSFGPSPLFGFSDLLRTWKE
jgi:peptide/nickel transport system substrate-binding protein